MTTPSPTRDRFLKVTMLAGALVMIGVGETLHLTAQDQSADPAWTRSEILTKRLQEQPVDGVSFSPDSLMPPGAKKEDGFWDGYYGCWITRKDWLCHKKRRGDSSFQTWVPECKGEGAAKGWCKTGEPSDGDGP